MSKIFSAFLFLLFSTSLLFSQDQGKPFLRNYTPKEYKGHAQNWSMAQDHRGIVYVGNGNGVMEYDGSIWRMIELPNKVTARSMATDENGVVYVGTSNGFGYISLDNVGNSTFVPLDSLLADTVREQITDIWATDVIGTDVYFRTYKVLYRYSNGKVDCFRPKQEGRLFFTSFLLKDKYYLEEAFRGSLDIWVVEKDSLSPITPSDNERFQGKAISTMFPYKQDTILLGARNGNFFKYPFSQNPDTDTTFLSSINSTIAKYRVYTNAVKYDGGYAIGSIGSGLLLFDNDYQFIRKIDQETNNLQNNLVYSLSLDRDGAAWVGGGNGISRVGLSSEVSYWDKDSGLKGTVNWIKRFKEKLYVATSAATFVFDGNKPVVIPRTTETQCWHMLPYINPENPDDERLLLSTGLIWELNESVAAKPVLQFPHIATVFKMYLDKSDPYRVWLAFGDGFGSMRFDTSKKEPRWIYEGKIDVGGDNCRSIAQSPNGDIWIGTFRNGVIRLKKKEGERNFEVIKYKEESGLLSTKNVIIYEAIGDIIFGTDKGLCSYNPKTDKFEPYTKFGEEYSDGSKDVFSLQEDAKGNVWICGLFNNSSPGVVAEYQIDGTFKINNNPFKNVPPMMVLGMTVEPDGTAWLGGSEGVFRYKSNPAISKSDAVYHALIRKVTIGEDSTIFGGGYTKKVGDFVIASLPEGELALPVVDADYNSVSFSFSSPFFDNEEQTQYKFYLEGFEDNWSEWGDKRGKEYNNLSAGEYTFYLKAKNLYGNESTEAIYKFEVLPPWHKTWWAYLLYILLAVVIIRLAVKWNAKRLEVENERLESLVEERTAEVRAKSDQLSLSNMELNQQKEEVLAQAENLRELNEEISAVNSDLNAKSNALQKANTNVQNLSAIGKTITSTLDIREVIRIVYENVNNLMDASGFGIGVYNPTENVLEFKGYMEKGEVLADHNESLGAEDTSVATEVFHSGEMYFSNDLEDDFAKSGKSLDVLQGDVPLSLIYIPLIYGEQKVGVITVQSFEKHAYSDGDLNIIETLASYASIALANARGYEVIQSKNKHITDGIRYSQTIQNAFLPSRKALTEALGGYSLFHQPKDIVSGDFYWMSQMETKNKCFVAVVDCTGHGVPGAFMSVVGSNLLNEIINLKEIYSPAEVLEQLNKGVISTLSQNEAQANDDGMDVCLCLLEKQDDGTTKVTFSGAKRDLLVMRKGSPETLVFSGDRKLIGGRQKAEKSFSNQEILLQKGDRVYLTTDGFVDQHNEERRKFGTLQLKSLLGEIYTKNIEEQEAVFKDVFERHKGSIEQRDDVTILGFEA